MSRGGEAVMMKYSNNYKAGQEMDWKNVTVNVMSDKRPRKGPTVMLSALERHLTDVKIL